VEGIFVNTKEALAVAIQQLHNHNNEYQHRTPDEMLAELKAANDEPTSTHHQRLQQLIHERDRVVTQNEELRATLMMYSRVANYLPVVGVTCDGDGCNAAIGIVGAKLVNADAITEDTLSIATKIGWETTLEKLDVRPRHYCPKCQSTKGKAAP
jgi:hypothetical protein